MRLRAKTLLYFRGHFVAEGAEFDAPSEVGERFVQAGKAEKLDGGKGTAQTQIVDLSQAPAPAANLQPVGAAAPKRKTSKPKTEA